MLFVKSTGVCQKEVSFSRILDYFPVIVLKVLFVGFAVEQIVNTVV